MRIRQIWKHSNLRKDYAKKSTTFETTTTTKRYRNIFLYARLFNEATFATDLCLCKMAGLRHVPCTLILDLTLLFCLFILYLVHDELDWFSIYKLIILDKHTHTLEAAIWFCAMYWAFVSSWRRRSRVPAVSRQPADSDRQIGTVPIWKLDSALQLCWVSVPAKRMQAYVLWAVED